MTANNLTQRPEADEYDPYYAGYVASVPAGVNISEFLASGMRQTAETFGAFPQRDWGFRYAPGKWSVREVGVHMADTERVMAYRALRISRADATPLPGFDQDAWVPHSGAEGRSLDSIVDELTRIRQATLAFVSSLTDEQWKQRGTASDAGVSVRALVWIIAGHEAHHLDVLNDRYLSAAQSASGVAGAHDG